MPALLAVDLGLRTGLALYGGDGRLRWYRSRNFGSRAHLRRGVGLLLNELEEVAWIVMEGGGPLADIWEREAVRLGIRCQRISAEEWRVELLYPRQMRTGRLAKRNADGMARRVIRFSRAPRPTALRHDAAEAILIGFWAVRQMGWLAEPVDVILRG